MPETSPQALHPDSSHRRWLLLAVEAGLILRIIAADAVEWVVQRSGRAGVCVFPDADYYWKLAQTIRRGELFQIVEWGDIPHFALRTPGYPLFLAGCQLVAGDRPIAARLAQTVLGALTVWLVYRLTRSARGTGIDRVQGPSDRGGPDGGSPVHDSHVGGDPFRGGLRAAHAGCTLGDGGALGSAGTGTADGRRGLGRRVRERGGGADAAVVVAVRPSDVRRVAGLAMARGPVDRAGGSGRRDRDGRFRGGDGSVVVSQRDDLRPVRPHRPLDGREPVRRAQPERDGGQ